jgi:hypothetical protein
MTPTWTPETLVAVVLVFTWALAFMARLADKLEPNPFDEPVVYDGPERRHG